jgi:hypothetical protein
MGYPAPLSKCGNCLWRPLVVWGCNHGSIGTRTSISRHGGCFLSGSGASHSLASVSRIIALRCDFLIYTNSFMGSIFLSTGKMGESGSPVGKSGI